MTRLSRYQEHDDWTIAELPGVARLSLCLVVSMLFGVPTCLVTSTTEFPEATPTAPFVDPNTATATVGKQTGIPPGHMIFIDPGPSSSRTFEDITFSVAVRGEDAGRTLQARAFVDYGISKETDVKFVTFGGGDALPQATFNEVRTIKAYLKPHQLSSLHGCHQVTLFVSYTFDSKTFVPPFPAETTFVVWWMLIEHPGEEQTLANTCPPGSAAPDSDAGEKRGL